QVVTARVGRASRDGQVLARLDDEGRDAVVDLFARHVDDRGRIDVVHRRHGAAAVVGRVVVGRADLHREGAVVAVLVVDRERQRRIRTGVLHGAGQGD